MAIKMRDLLGGARESLRYEPTEKHLRAYLGDELVADTRQGQLVWEPGRVVPTYAVPASDILARLEPVDPVDDAAAPAEGSIRDPRIPFASHSCPGRSFDAVATHMRCPAAAFRPDDLDLADYVILDFTAFQWREEDESLVAHPHDPFKRIDILASSRRVQIEWDGQLLADSSRPLLLFETLLPVRFYLPRADVVVALAPSDTVTYCAYKGRACYYSLAGGPADLAWSYPEPLSDAERLRHKIAFFNERVDITVDGHRWERPFTQWS